jgi:hypothetical protein
MDEQPDSAAKQDADEIVRTNKPGRRLGAMVSVRLTPDEDAAVREEADRRGVSISELVRSAVLREVGLSQARVMAIDKPDASNVQEPLSVEVRMGERAYGAFVNMTGDQRVA